MKRMIFFIALLAVTPLSQAQDFSGEWFMKAAGWPFILKITQSGSTLSGTMEAVGNTQPTSMIYGSVLGTRITFTRYSSILPAPQVYDGFLYEYVPNDNEMAGTFTHLGITSYGWNAERQE